MPLPSGKATFEEALILMQSTADPLELVRHIPAIAEGFADLKDRMSAIEKGYLDLRVRMVANEKSSQEALASVGSIGSDTKKLQSRFDTLESTPTAHATRLDVLDTRIRTVEGAVGAVPKSVIGETKPATPSPVPAVPPAPPTP